MAERGVIDLGGFDIEGGHGREAGKAHAGRGKLLCKSQPASDTESSLFWHMHVAEPRHPEFDGRP